MKPSSSSRRQSKQPSHNAYEKLEPRHLLAVTVGPDTAIPQYIALPSYSQQSYVVADQAPIEVSEAIEARIPISKYIALPSYYRSLVAEVMAAESSSVGGSQLAQSDDGQIGDSETVQPESVRTNSVYDVTPGSDLISNLGTTTPVEDRMELLREHLDLGKFDSYQRIDLDRDQIGFAHFKYQQYFNNIAVENGTYKVHSKDGEIVRLSGNFIDVETTQFTAKISEATAFEHALDFVGADEYMWEVHDEDDHEHGDDDHDHDHGHDHDHDHAGHGHHDHSDFEKPEGELVYVGMGDSEAVLAYKFDIYATAPLSRQIVFVSSQDGQVVDSRDRIYHADVDADGTSLYNGTVDFVADSFSGGNRLRQVVNGVETYDLNNGTNYGSATDITSSTTSFTATDVQTGVQAHFGAEQTLDYFFTSHGRDSYDDNGTVLLSYVSYSSNYNNAFWDGSRMTYGDGDGTSYNPLVSLDIVGHEISHGVTEFTAGLIYAYESGALNESFSDIFGETVENYATGGNDWLMGEDIAVNPGNALRSMSDPPAKGHPDTYLGVNWWTSAGDNGGVHINSGVQNKWFYVLAEGETDVNDNGTPYDVTGIGIPDAAAIAYRNLSVYLTASSQFIDAREGSIQSAIDLFGENSQQHLSTIEAWNAVGLGGSNYNVGFDSVTAEGSSLYRGNVSGQILGSGLVDTLSFDLDPNQTMSVAVTGDSGLVPSIEIYDPNEVLIGSGVGNNLTVSDLGVSVAGTYQILVTGDVDSSGPYSLDVILNGTFEAEVPGGNDSLANAEDISGSAMSVGTDATVDRVAVMGDLSPEQLTIAADDFETGSLDSAWATTSSDADGRIVVTNSFAADGSTYSLFMDQTTNGTFNLNEAVWTVDLTGVTSANLNFSHAEWGDETHVLPASFTGSSNGDGVAISADGNDWFTVLTNTDSSPGVWNSVTIDLAAAASAAGIALGANFQIKFQQYDNFIYSSDGRGYDQISITESQASPDWFSFEVLSGQTVSLAATGAGSGVAQVDLYDENETLIQSGVAGAEVDTYVSRFTNAGATANFYAHVTGPDALDYNLVVTRGADFDFEPNDVETPQVLSGNGGVFGYVSAVDQVSAEPDTVAAETIINTTFAGVTLSNNLGGNIFAADATGFGAPTGSNSYGPTATGAAGFREGESEFRADFDIPQSTVSIDVGSDDASDVGLLRAYDASDNLLAEVTSDAIGAGGSETITISRPTADIAYVIAAGKGTDITPLDNLVYQVVGGNDDFYTIAAVENDQFTLDAFLPGAGPHLFNNPLDASGGSLLSMELRDPNGVLIGTDSDSLSHTVTVTGDYELRVLATASLGEYFVEHWYNHAPSSVVDDGTTDEDTLMNIDVLANDSDLDGDTYSVTAVTNPTNGTAVISGDGTIDYTPSDDYFGSDTFDYSVTDEHGAVSTGTVNVAVNAVNDAPTDFFLSSNTVAENTDTSSALDVGTLTADDVDSTSFTYSLVAGNGDVDNNLFQVDGDTLRVKAGVELDYETKPQYELRMEVSDGEFTYQKAFVVDVTDHLEIGSTTIDNGTAQRSTVRELVVTFDDIVTVSTGAFSLIQRGPAGGAVTLGQSVTESGGATIVTLTFSGQFVNAGSLNDGNYELTVDGSLIQSTASGQLLDGDSDGVAGGNYLFGDTIDDQFFRFFGDSDGDRDVDGIDFGQFRNTFFKSAGDPDYNRDFDYDDDGDVDGIDFGQFRQRFFSNLEFE
ncbi:MAG: M4 family metallopeptidase [Mariniblastus sp.]